MSRSHFPPARRSPMKRSPLPIVLALTFGLVALFPPAIAVADDGKTPPLKLLKSLPLGGEGRWDYLYADADARRLYIARSTHVQVLDLEKETVIGDVPGTNGVHGVAVAPEQNLGFASSGRDNAVTVFELKTFKVTKTIKAGRNPDAV